MAKKMDEAEIKKECPSCGLGVALDATICEFCGWDFEEEDEWILQIEKLERDLMLEKQKFEPGSVNEKIEATLHNPAATMKAIKSAEKAAPKKAPPVVEPEKPAPAPKPAPRPLPQAAPPPKHAPVVQAPVISREEVTAPKVRRVRTVRTASSPSTEGGFVSPRKSEEEPELEEAAQQAPISEGKKVRRIVRKVK
jgi:hypothetical protein